MDREKKRAIAFGILIGGVILFAIFYYLWGLFLNRGTIRIIGQSPFSVEIFGEKSETCDTSPCEIMSKIGEKTLILEKEDRQAKVMTVEVKLWRTIDVEVDFDIKAYLMQVDEFPQKSEQHEYELIFDDDKGMQKLIKKGDQNEVGLIYFPKNINATRIFGSKYSVLIVDNNFQTYRVDLIDGKKFLVENFRHKIKDGKWSENGKYFVFSVEGGENLLMLDNENKERELELQVPASQVAWNYNNELVFVTTQGTRTDAGYVKLLQEVLIGTYNFGYYFPKLDAYSLIDGFTELEFDPRNLVPLSNGNEIYFQAGEQNFKLVVDKILEKF